MFKLVSVLFYQPLKDSDQILKLQTMTCQQRCHISLVRISEAALTDGSNKCCFESSLSSHPLWLSSAEWIIHCQTHKKKKTHQECNLAAAHGNVLFQTYEPK